MAQINFNTNEPIQLQPQAIRSIPMNVHQTSVAPNSSFAVHEIQAKKPNRVFINYSDQDNIPLLRELLKLNPFSARYGAKLDAWKNLSIAFTNIGHPASSKRCRDYMEKLVDDHEKSEWYNIVSSGGYLELNEFQTLMKKVIELKNVSEKVATRPKAAFNSAETLSPPEDISHHSLNTSNLNVATTHMISPAPIGESTFTNGVKNLENAFKNLAQDAFAIFPNPSDSNLGSKNTRPRAWELSEVNNSIISDNASKKPCTKDTLFVKHDVEYQSLKHQLQEVRNEVQEVKKSLVHTNELLNKLLTENQTAYAQFLTVIKELIQQKSNAG